MEALIIHIYLYAEYYVVPLAWLVVALAYAAAYVYFIRHLRSTGLPVETGKPQIKPTDQKPPELRVVPSEPEEKLVANG